jgi:homocitrate synthase
LRVHEIVRTLRGIVTCNIEFHGHNDTGCAVANAYAALAAGATHIDASVLGIGERNGITPLGGFIARMYAYDPDLVRSRYHLPVLRRVENLVADLVGIDVPFNNYITGYAAFMHKAGIHAKAMLNNPSTYEILDPADFGMDRYIHVAHRLTGWNAIKHRAQQLQLDLSDDQIRSLTARIKHMADDKPMSLDDVDALLRDGHRLEGGKQ